MHDVLYSKSIRVLWTSFMSVNETNQLSISKFHSRFRKICFFIELSLGKKQTTKVVRETIKIPRRIFSLKSMLPIMQNNVLELNCVCSNRSVRNWKSNVKHSYKNSKQRKMNPVDYWMYVHLKNIDRSHFSSFRK